MPMLNTGCSICGRPVHAYGFCNTHYRQRKRQGVVMQPPDEVQRFWSKVDTSSDCWIWTAGRGRGGYGKFRANGRSVPAHRYSFLLHHGNIPDDKFVCHTCDNRICVRPDHLYAGTHQDNMRDRAERGRAAFGERNGTYLHPERILKGEQVAQAKLDADKVQAIRQEYAAGGQTHHRLAAKYGVGKSLIDAILKRKVWKHVA